MSDLYEEDKKRTNKERRNAQIMGQAVETTYGRVNRMLGAPDDMRITLVTPFHSIAPIAPGWTDGKDIYINAADNFLKDAFLSGRIGVDEVMSLSGLNYHELSHCFFTPSMTGALASRVRNDGGQHAWNAFNILEDQKVDSIFVARYEPARHYFTKIIDLFLRDTAMQAVTNYMVVAGRLFLPPDLRMFFRDNFIAPQHINEIEEIVMAYRVERDEDKMGDLIFKFAALMEKIQGDFPSVPQPTITQHQHGQRGQGEITEEMQQEMDRQAQNDPVINTPPNSSGSGEEDGEKAEGQSGDGSGDAEGEEQGHKRRTTSDTSSGGTDDSDADSGGSGASTGSQEQRDPKELDKEQGSLLDKAVEEAKQQIGAELRKQQQAIRSNTKNYSASSERVNAAGSKSPTQEDNRIVKQVVREFRVLEKRFKPGWHRRQSSGSIDGSRLHRVKDYDFDVFKKWKEGKNKLFNYEITILIDTSGSMSGNEIEQASRSAWHLHKAFSDLDAKVTVLGYNSRTSLLLDRSDSAPKRVPMYQASGGTTVTPAMQQARNYHDTSTQDKHICFIITDGAFSDTWDSVQLMKEFGYPIILIGIGGGARVDQIAKEGPFWLRATRTLSTSADLVKVVKDYVMDAVKADL